MISDITVGHVYRSPSGLPFQVLAKAAHGQDCSVPMIVYQNLTATYDYPPGKVWVESESMFLKQFTEYDSGVYYDFNYAATPEGARL